MLFVEAHVFTVRLKDLLDDETYRQLQNELAASPEKGAVIRGCGGLRKVRVEQPKRGKGKRGGCRIIYLYIREVDRIDFLAIYGKDEQDDLTADQRKRIKSVAERARREALERRPMRKER